MQLIAELCQKPIDFIQIIDPRLEETHYWGEVKSNKKAFDIWIGEQDKLGKGYGTSMMKLAIQKCFKDQSRNGILVDPLKSNKKAHRFYERLGFQFLEEIVLGDSLCFIYELKRKQA